MPPDSPASFTPAEVRSIRAQHLAKTLSVRAWADAKGCGLETIRRIARRDTYRHIDDSHEASAPTDEPSSEEVAASLERLSAVAQSLPPQRQEIHDILDDLTRKGGSK